jgi:uncharacterized membrane protein YkoI
MILLRSLFIAALLASALCANAAPASQISYSTLQARGISLEQAIAMVQAKYGAKVMKANSVEEGGRVVHYIRLMTQDRSRVWTVRVDAATGQEF